jgi:predicted transcriptional regulator
MEPIIFKVIEAREKDLILIYLRGQSKARIQLNDIRKAVLPNTPLKKIQQYYEELRKEDFIWDDNWNKMNVTYQTKSDVFIESGGFVKRLFENEINDFSERELLENHHKDLILYWIRLDNTSALFRTVVIKQYLFPNLDIFTIRYYIDKLREEGYIWVTPSDPYCFRYYKSADKFLEDGGYTGKYLHDLKEKSENEKERQELSPKEIKRRDEVDRKNQYIETFKTRALYALLRYGAYVFIGVLILTIILILFGIITSQEALKGFKWLWSIIF